MPIVKDREQIRNPLDFLDVFKAHAEPKDLVEQLGEVNIGVAGWREVLPEIDEVSRKLSTGSNLTEVAAESQRNSLAAAVLGNILPKNLTDSAYKALEQLYFSLPKADTDFDLSGNPGFNDDDLDF